MKKNNLLILLSSLLIIKANINLEVANYIKFEPSTVHSIIKKYLPENPYILEAGACDGTDTIRLSKIWPKGKCFAFEPVPELFSKLSNRCGNISNVYKYELALSDKTGQSTFYLSKCTSNPGEVCQSSSLLEPKDHLIHVPQILFNDSIIVKTITIDEWAKQNNIDHIDLMWLDMQGSELNALMASPNILKTVKVILTEVEFVEAYKDQYLCEDVKKWLEDQGFTMIGLHLECKWFGNALFVANDLLK